MWLLDTTTYRLHFVQDPSSVSYAILSHVWDRRGEQTFQDVQNVHASVRQAFPAGVADDDPHLLALLRDQLGPKITRLCDHARAEGYAYAWNDTCCIDKTNSAELSEAISSMFDWYALAAVCYVFLGDVEDVKDGKRRRTILRWNIGSLRKPRSKESDSFRWSMWFRRGWTLQELIAPRHSVFFSQNWKMIGTKAGLAELIEEITGVDQDILLHRRPLDSVSVARRMYWAKWRETSRVEDEAYSLMGLFGIRLPAIYGEGRHAFVRLQEEIMMRIPDHSLFAWGLALPVQSTDGPLPPLKQVPAEKLRASKGAYLFASHPTDFQYSSTFSPIPFGDLVRRLGIPLPSEPSHFFPTGYGVRATLPVWPVTFPSKEGGLEVHLAVLACEDSHGRIPAIVLPPPDVASTLLIGGYTPEHGFSYKCGEGIVSPQYVASDHDRYAVGQVCRKELTRSEWMRRARADATRHSKEYPRLALLETPLIDNLRHDGRVVLHRDLCVPYHRLQVESSLLVFGRSARGMDNGFTSCCKIIFPPWTLAHFQDVGITADVTLVDGVMRAVPLWNFGDHSSISFALCHSTQTITLKLAACPTAKRDGPLHASVSWTKVDLQGSPKTDQEDRPSEHVLGDCDSEHVNAWADGHRIFHGPSDGLATVALCFRIWDADELSGLGLGSLYSPLYALDVRVEIPSASLVPSAATV